jgi:hypothetical protein
MVGAVQIDLLYGNDCANRVLARERLDAALARVGLASVVRECEVRSADDAARLGMRGSPTVLVDGHDPFADGVAAASLSCRLYDNGDGLEGAPSVAGLVEALSGHCP